jgi:hypothetical protein
MMCNVNCALLMCTCIHILVHNSQDYTLYIIVLEYVEYIVSYDIRHKVPRV